MVFYLCQLSVLQYGLFRTRKSLSRGDGFVLSWILFHVRYQRTCDIHWALGYDGMIDLLHFSVLEELSHSGEGFAGSAEDKGATHWPIESMWQAQKDVTWFIVFLLDVFLNDFDHVHISGAVAL